MKRAALAGLLALGLTVASYAALGSLLGLWAGWSAETARDQALGLGLHAAVAYLRGVLPSVLLVLLGERALRARGRHRATRLALAVAAAALASLVFLALPLGPLPRLVLPGPAEVAVTVLLLAAAACLAIWGAERILGSAQVATPGTAARVS